MSPKLSDVLKNTASDGTVSPKLGEYENLYKVDEAAGVETRNRVQKTLAETYYDLVTDFYEYGWGRSFHFAPRAPGESFHASLARHEHYLAHMLGLRPGMVVADLGCGVGGPLREIARFSGARIVGVNTNAYQLERARKLTREAGLDHLAEYVHGDFLHVDAPDNSFDAIYSIEATCHAQDKASVYREVFRLLKPGACFGNYEYILTDRFDPEDETHLKIKAGIELGGGILELGTRQVVDDALRQAGFEVLEETDLSVQTGPSIPWYEPMVGSGLSFASFRSSRFGRSVTLSAVRALETLRFLPRGSARVLRKLDLCASSLAEGGRLAIFTPMYFQHARKPG